jgi:hypothetical protein
VTAECLSDCRWLPGFLAGVGRLIAIVKWLNGAEPITPAPANDPREQKAAGVGRGTGSLILHGERVLRCSSPARATISRTVLTHDFDETPRHNNHSERTLRIVTSCALVMVPSRLPVQAAAHHLWAVGDSPYHTWKCLFVTPIGWAWPRRQGAGGT